MSNGKKPLMGTTLAQAVFRKGGPGQFSLCQLFSWSATCWRDIKLLLTRTWRNSDFLIALFHFFFFLFLVQAAVYFGLLKARIVIWKSGSFKAGAGRGGKDPDWIPWPGEALLILLGLGSFGFYSFNIFKVIF